LLNVEPYFLVLANLSATAAQAACYAAVLGSPLHVRLALLHLYHTDLCRPELLAITTHGAYQSRAETATVLRALDDRLPASAERKVTTADLAGAVVGALHRYRPLLLAVGLRRPRDAAEKLMRKQALPALRATLRPLLVVPEGIKPPCVPRRVLVAVDAEPFAPSATTRQLAPLLAAWGATYLVVHVASSHERELWPGQLVLNQVQASQLLPAGPAPQLHYVASPVAPALGIQRVLDMTQPDLLILLVRPRSFSGPLFQRSVTAQVLAQATVPVLLLPIEPPPSA
jgi:nucleotide-binding universal stress UspA family protein